MIMLHTAGGVYTWDGRDVLGSRDEVDTRDHATPYVPTAEQSKWWAIESDPIHPDNWPASDPSDEQWSAILDALDVEPAPAWQWDTDNWGY